MTKFDRDGMKFEDLLTGFIGPTELVYRNPISVHRNRIERP